MTDMVRQLEVKTDKLDKMSAQMDKMAAEKDKMAAKMNILSREKEDSRQRFYILKDI